MPLFGSGCAGLGVTERKLIGADIKAVQHDWPMGMPIVRKLEGGLWEVRTRLPNGRARVLFTVEVDTIVLLHGFMKQTNKTPVQDLELARQRLRTLRGHDQ